MQISKYSFGLSARAPAAIALLLFAWPLAGQETAKVISLEEIERGQTGYGLSVFAGGEPERFQVEVLGLMRNTSPDLSYILAKLTGKGLEMSGVVGGMSGSPVFINDRLAGAVAFSWSFSLEAIAGITPIGAMRRLSDLPSDGVSPTRASDLELRQLLNLPGSPELLERELQKLGGELPLGARSNLQWTSRGFGDPTRSLLGRVLGPIAPAGKASDLEGNLDPGSAVAGVLMDGDLQLAVTGTVTHRDGEEILAFGHSFLGVGPLRIPMAPAEVVTVVASRASSFKVTNVGTVIGAFDQDRQAGMRGRLGLEAPTIPLTLRVRGLEERDYNMRLAELPLLNPSLIASAVLQVLETASYSTGAQGLELEARFELVGHEDVVVRQNFDGDNATFSAAIYLLGLTGFLTQNTFEEVHMRGLEVELRQTEAPRTATLVAAHADRTQVRPGEKLRLSLELLAYRGEPFRHSLEIDVPDDLPAGSRYYLFVGDGTSVDAARDQLEPMEPGDFSQALKLLRSFHPKSELVVLGFFADRGLMVAGRALPQLPGSIRAIWQASSTPGTKPLRFSIAQEHVEMLGRPLDGLVRIDLRVLKRDPSPGENGSGSDDSDSPATRGGSNERPGSAEERG